MATTFKYQAKDTAGKTVSGTITAESQAQVMEDELQDGAEKSAGMRKLLEAKDCFVRSRLENKK